MERSGKEWTDDETARLKKLSHLGLTVEEVSRVLQRTTLGILYKMWLEGVPKKVTECNMNSITVKKLLKCSSENITGICKELYHGDYAPDRQKSVLRVLLTLDLCRDKWVAKKREEKKVFGVVYTLHEVLSAASTDLADFGKEICVRLKFEELVKALSLELNVPPVWIKDKIRGILFK